MGLCGECYRESGERSLRIGVLEEGMKYGLDVDRILTLSYLFLLIIGSQLSLITGFNVDTASVISHRGPTGSMFGFSVAQHRDSNVSWLLVGAPQADSRQPGVSRAGAVFRCSCEASDTCQLVPFDRTGNNVVQNLQIDEKSNQWFGATVKSSGEDGIILACAPRYTWFTSNRKRRDPVGTCFVAKDSFTEFVEYSPCRTTKWGYHRQGSCQIGLGADVDPAGRRIFLGAVGSWYWQGQLYSQSSSLRPDIRWTAEGPSWDDDSYLGYSVVSGEFSGDQDTDVAVGMPRGANLTGKVVIYSSDLTNLHNITGEQIGAYFGYSLCVLDVDGDGLDDIVIGAPMYTDYQDTAMKIETGRVYVVYQNKRHKFKRWDSLDGTAHRGRFGLSLTSLGDINRDGIDDFAVGAPYDGLYGRGAVYIFQGTQDGVRKEFTQVIYGSSLQHPLNTFGFSLSGGRDLDGNGYPDLVVGAYDSDVVALFRSRPVVRVRSKLTFTSGKQINLDQKECTLKDGRTRVACFPLFLCMSYEGFGADDVIDFNVQYVLDSKKTKEQRLFFLDNEGVHTMNSTIRLRKRVEECSNTQVYIRAQIRDKLTSLEAELRYSMEETRTRHLSPVIDVTGSTTERDSVSIRKDCGPDNVCVPDLRLQVSQSDEAFIMGSTGRIWIEVEVYNNGEDSFESIVFIQVPQGLSYINADPLDTRKDVPILCSAPSPSTNNTIRCDIGNPLPAFAKAKLKVYFQTREGTDLKRGYEFFVSTNSTNPEEAVRTADNYKSIFMPIDVETDIGVYGSSKPQPVPYNASFYRGKVKLNESHIGPEVEHVYEVKCLGPSNIEEALVTIFWPSFTLDGDHFLYLLEEPRIDGPATCEPIGAVNPLGIKIQKQKQTRKHTAHTSDTTVQEGEGRRRNFTQSSEVTTDGGTYTHTYRNTSFETRRTTNVVTGTSHSGRQDSSAGVTGVGGSSSFSAGNSDNNVAQQGRSSSTTSFIHSSRGSTPTVTSQPGPGITHFNSRHGTTSNFDSSGSRTSSNFDPSRDGSIGFRGDFVSEETSYRSGGNGYTGSVVPKYGERGYIGGERTKVSSQSTTVERPYSRNGNYSGGESYVATGNYGIGNGGSFTEEGTFRNKSGTSGFSGSSQLPSGVNSESERHRGTTFISSNTRGHSETISTFNGRRRGGEGEDHVSFDNGSEENFLDRQKRELARSRGSEEVVTCGNAKCIKIHCKIGQLTSDSSVIFILRGRVYADTLEAKFGGEKVEISSKLTSRVTQLPNNVSPEVLETKEFVLVSTVEEEPDLSLPSPIAWWVYVLAAILGLLFLLLIIYLLYKCGFFKRRRPNSTPEGQPLHRNGYQERM